MNDWEARQRARACIAAEAVAAETGVPAEAILGRRRYAPIVKARHRLFVTLWREGHSIAEVARMLQMNHATVIAGLRLELGNNVYEEEVAKRWPTSNRKPRKPRTAPLPCERHGDGTLVHECETCVRWWNWREGWRDARRSQRRSA